MVADRLAEWKKTNEQVKKTTASSQKRVDRTKPFRFWQWTNDNGNEENQASIITNESSEGQYQTYGQ